MIKSGTYVAYVDQCLRQDKYDQGSAAKKGVADSRRDSPADKPPPFCSSNGQTTGWDWSFRLIDAVFVNRGKLVNYVPAVLVAN